MLTLTLFTIASFLFTYLALVAHPIPTSQIKITTYPVLTLNNPICIPEFKLSMPYEIPRQDPLLAYSAETSSIAMLGCYKELISTQNPPLIADFRNAKNINSFLTTHLQQISGKKLLLFYQSGNMHYYHSFGIQWQKNHETSKNLYLWNTISRTLYDLGEHNTIITEMAFSPDGTLLASGDCTGTIKLWDMYTKKCIKIVNLTQKKIVQLMLSHQNRYLAVLSYNSVTVWDLLTNNIIHEQATINHGERFKYMQFSSDENLLITETFTRNSVSIFNLKKKELVQTILAPSQLLHDKCPHFCCTPDTTCIASWCNDRLLSVWNIQKNTLVENKFDYSLSTLPRSIITTHPFKVAAFSPNNNLIALGNSKGAVSLWHWQKPQERKLLRLKKTPPISALAFSPDGNYLLIGSGNERLDIFLIKYEEAASATDQI